jgi:hypothetical protein
MTHGRRDVRQHATGWQTNEGSDNERAQPLHAGKTNLIKINKWAMGSASLIGELPTLHRRPRDAVA